MTKPELTALLAKLEQHHGSIGFAEPGDPYELIVYTNCVRATGPYRRNSRACSRAS